MFEKISRWLVYGVLLSVGPFTLLVVRNWIVDNRVLELEYLLDLLLITFAIAVNALSLITDKGKKIRKEIKGVCEFLSGLSMLFCIAIYFSFFENCFLKDKLLEQFMAIDYYSVENILSNEEYFKRLEITKQLVTELNPKNEKLVIFIVITVGILIINSIIGIVAEIIDGSPKKKQGTNQSNNNSNEHMMQQNIESNHEKEVPV